MYQKKNDLDIRCPLEYGVNLISGKWKTRIICLIGSTKPQRYGELKEKLINITDGVLSTTLNELIRTEMVEKISDENDNIANYCLTEKAKTLLPLLKKLCQWSSNYYGDNCDIVMEHCKKCAVYKSRRE